MKRFTSVVLMLCIAMMCTTPFEAQSQTRRGGGSSSGTTTRKEQSEQKIKPSEREQAPQARPSQQKERPAQQNARPAQQQRKSQPAPQVQDRRTTRPEMNQPRQQQKQQPRQQQPPRQQQRQQQPRQHKPDAIQYHNKPPKPRGHAYQRPHLEPRHRPVPAYRYGNHYFGHRLRTLPPGYRLIRVRDLDYYYYDGIYYRPYPLGGYYVCRPPMGTAIASTLFDVALTAVVINALRSDSASKDQEYYYQDGVFYILKNGQYYVIEAPIGALVTEIPADYEEVEIDGKTYYRVEDTLFGTTVIDGALYFEVIANL